jgi:hypothetical protein
MTKQLLSVAVCCIIRDSHKLRQGCQPEKKLKCDAERGTDIIESISLLQLLYNVSKLMF